MDPNDWAALEANYLDDTYYQATLTWNGISETIGVRSHGGGSRSPVKPNLDLNFAHVVKTQSFLNLPFIVMKANNEDPSNLHEWLSMKIFRRMGFPAPREAPAQIRVNGTLLGLYFIIEHLDDTFLQRTFGESTGYLYEWENQGDNYDFQNLGADPNLYANYLDLKDGPGLARSAEFFGHGASDQPTGERHVHRRPIHRSLIAVHESKQCSWHTRRRRTFWRRPTECGGRA